MNKGIGNWRKSKNKQRTDNSDIWRREATNKEEKWRKELLREIALLRNCKFEKKTKLQSGHPTFVLIGSSLAQPLQMHWSHTEVRYEHVTTCWSNGEGHVDPVRLPLSHVMLQKNVNCSKSWRLTETKLMISSFVIVFRLLYNYVYM